MAWEVAQSNISRVKKVHVVVRAGKVRVTLRCVIIRMQHEVDEFDKSKVSVEWTREEKVDD